MLLKNRVGKKDIFYLIDKYSCAISRVEAEMLLEYLFNCERLDLYIRDFSINKTMEELYDSLISRRLKGEPVQYITGCTEFMGLDFIVTKDVLIPRPETELLVNVIRDTLSVTQTKNPKILDLCTGSGNIAVSLSKLMPQSEIVATDMSEAALKIAEKNAARHNLSDRVRFYKGDLFNALIFAKNPKFDIIVCNPPYIKEDELSYLQKEVKTEPEIALNGGKDGLDFYRIIAKESYRYLEKGGSILLEIGFGQKKDVENIFSSYSIFEICRVIKDFNNIPRVMWFNLI
nr:peptide chain release factor N(5)-glutamine methyltransferase [Candidatus Omnitrophota bacterium]